MYEMQRISDTFNGQQTVIIIIYYSEETRYWLRWILVPFPYASAYFMYAFHLIWIGKGRECAENDPTYFPEIIMICNDDHDNIVFLNVLNLRKHIHTRMLYCIYSFMIFAFAYIMPKRGIKVTGLEIYKLLLLLYYTYACSFVCRLSSCMNSCVWKIVCCHWYWYYHYYYCYTLLSRVGFNSCIFTYIL